MKKILFATILTLTLGLAPTAAAQGHRACHRSPDINKDGYVNIIDLSTLLSSYGKKHSNHKADLNCDGAVNALDLSILLSAYGKPA